MLDFAVVEKRLKAMPGVANIAMNAGSTAATITFDGGKTNPAALAKEIEACGFHCRGKTARAPIIARSVSDSSVT